MFSYVHFFPLKSHLDIFLRQGPILSSRKWGLLSRKDQSVNTTSSGHSNQLCHRNTKPPQEIYKQMWLCSNKTLLAYIDSGQ